MDPTVFLSDGVLRDLDVDALVDAFQTQTTAGRTALRERLSAPTAEPIELHQRQEELRDIRQRIKENRETIQSARASLAETESDVKSLADAHNDSRHAEYYNQILWAHDSFTARLNPLGWLTELIVLFRTVLLPGLALLMPVLILLAPFLVFQFVLKEPITVSRYFSMIQSSMRKAVPSVLGAPRFSGSGGALEVGEQFLHAGVAIAVFVGSIWSQISSALSMRKVVADMRRRAASVRTFAAAIQKLETALLGVSSTPDSFSASDLGLFGEAWNDASRMEALLRRAGELDMLAAVALKRRTCFVRYSKEGACLTDLYHPGLSAAAAITNTVRFSPRRHILLTGPNRGGKSTLLKSLGAAVLMSQTLGVVFARRASLPVFGSVVSALSPTDTLGRLSLFESEIEFAKSVLGRLDAEPDTPMFLLMDEIFHGTNALDGVEASQVFLNELYEKRRDYPVFSVVSTHYMDLPARYGEEGLTQNLCMDASQDAEDPDRLIYTYRLKEGVNRLSSVREILRERGLCGPVAEKSSVPASSE